MKQLLFLLLAALTFVSCTNRPQEGTCCGEMRHPKYAYSASIYELNVRQLTEEGTFRAAEAVLPEIQQAGVDIIWVMPCQPIGELTRKGTLGSYYSIRDYCAINPEFGTMDDFRHFLSTAHQMGFKVILDWVANHTSPDHAWTANPDWHMRDAEGKLMIQYDWTDISKLNYDNQNMRQAMKQCMHYWMDSIGIDGFRCDVAGEIPVDFWNDVMAELRATHPDMFTLAENEDKAFDMCETAFNMYYGWELHHLINNVAQGKNTVDDLWSYFNKVDTTLQPSAIRMNFTSNHDENSWNGTEQERLGNANLMFAAFTYIIPGMPMIYTGQPSGNHHRLAFFEKDCIDRVENAPEMALYHQMDSIRTANKALWANEKGGDFRRVPCDNDKIFACVRHKECKGCGVDNTVIALFNMSDQEQEVTLDLTGLEGKYTCMCCKHQKKFGSSKTIKLRPWAYKILTQ